MTKYRAATIVAILVIMVAISGALVIRDHQTRGLGPWAIVCISGLADGGSYRVEMGALKIKHLGGSAFEVTQVNGNLVILTGDCQYQKISQAYLDRKKIKRTEGGDR